MQILQCIEHAKLRAQIQMQSCVTHGSEIHQHYAAVSLLQRQGRIDRGRGGASATFGAEKGKNAGFPCTSTSPCSRGTTAVKRLRQCFGTGRIVKKLACPGSHGGNNGRWIRHFAVGEYGNLQSCGANEFDAMNGSLRIAWRDIDDHHT